MLTHVKIALYVRLSSIVWLCQICIITNDWMTSIAFILLAIIVLSIYITVRMYVSTDSFFVDQVSTIANSNRPFPELSN